MKKLREQEPEGFEELWILWRPHARATDGRGKARPTYRKWLLDGAEPADILDGARYHLRMMKPEDRPYIQGLSVYLNSEKWVDECEYERAYQARLDASAKGLVSQKPVAPKSAWLRQYEATRTGQE